MMHVFSVHSCRFKAAHLSCTVKQHSSVPRCGWWWKLMTAMRSVEYTHDLKLYCITPTNKVSSSSQKFLSHNSTELSANLKSRPTNRMEMTETEDKNTHIGLCIALCSHFSYILSYCSCHTTALVILILCEYSNINNFIIKKYVFFTTILCGNLMSSRQCPTLHCIFKIIITNIVQ